MTPDTPSCFFCHSRRQRNLILVGEDAVGNPELPGGMGVHAIARAIRYRDAYRKMRRVYWVCVRCFYVELSDAYRYRNITEKIDVVQVRRNV